MDFLANLDHRVNFVISVVDTFSPPLGLILAENGRGVVFERFVKP